MLSTLLIKHCNCLVKALFFSFFFAQHIQCILRAHIEGHPGSNTNLKLYGSSPFNNKVRHDQGVTRQTQTIFCKGQIDVGVGVGGGSGGGGGQPSSNTNLTLYGSSPFHRQSLSHCIDSSVP